jgi:hypothetical protein
MALNFPLIFSKKYIKKKNSYQHFTLYFRLLAIDFHCFIYFFIFLKKTHFFQSHVHALLEYLHLIQQIFS